MTSTGRKHRKGSPGAVPEAQHSEAARSEPSSLPAKESTAKYKPTGAEEAAAQAHFGRQRAIKPAPVLEVTVEDGVGKIDTDHPDKKVGMTLLYVAMGTCDVAFFEGLVGQMFNATATNGVTNPQALNVMLAVIKGIEPRDQLEAMLAAQMAAVHVAALNASRTLARSTTIAQQDSAERTFNKLTRTFATQLEALKRYRSTGEQKVTVQHVTVNDGGQAVVGAVTHGGRGDKENGR